MGKPHVITDENDEDTAWVHDASDESVGIVLQALAETEDGRSSFQWLRLRNGDLMLGVFPRGETYFAVEKDAAYPDWRNDG